MSASITRAWLDPRRHSVEGHTKQCILTFNGGIIWGPTHCHENTVELRDALRKADPRFDMIIMDKPHSVEGHTAWISVSRDDTVFLDKLHTHDNMSGLCTAIFNAQQFSEDEAVAAPSSQHPSPAVSSRTPLFCTRYFDTKDRTCTDSSFFVSTASPLEMAL
ncbi:hypothetical protein SLS62_000293 [Diatrype stigma]|uniref:Uncharacterized protein n=1 Tax=Diatrype stigma TaxID=117547 RepID=A0AAN9V4B9_9PEZI